MSKPNDCILQTHSINELIDENTELVVRILGERIKQDSEDMQFCLEYPNLGRLSDGLASELTRYAKQIRIDNRRAMNLPAFTVAEAKKLANDNYSSWGQWVIECLDDEELLEEIIDFDTIEDWIEIREQVADAHREIENTAF